ADEGLHRRLGARGRLFGEDTGDLGEVEPLEARAQDLAVHLAGGRALDLDRSGLGLAARDPAFANLGEADVAIGRDLLLRAEILLHHQARRADLGGRQAAHPGDGALIAAWRGLEDGLE